MNSGASHSHLIFANSRDFALETATWDYPSTAMTVNGKQPASKSLFLAWTLADKVRQAWARADVEPTASCCGHPEALL